MPGSDSVTEQHGDSGAAEGGEPYLQHFWGHRGSARPPAPCCYSLLGSKRTELIAATQPPTSSLPVCNGVGVAVRVQRALGHGPGQREHTARARGCHRHLITECSVSALARQRRRPVLSGCGGRGLGHSPLPSWCSWGSQRYRPHPRGPRLVTATSRRRPGGRAETRAGRALSLTPRATNSAQ